LRRTTLRWRGNFLGNLLAGHIVRDVAVQAAIGIDGAAHHLRDGLQKLQLIS